MMNPADIFKIKGAWDRFAVNHPKFPKFLQAASTMGMAEGTIIEVKITRADGESIASNVKLTAEDMELFREIRTMSGR